MSLMWQGRCGLCKGEGHAGHHIIHRRFKSAKFSLMNGIYVCTPCHQWADANEAALIAVLEEKYPALHAWHVDNKPIIHQMVEWYTYSWFEKQKRTLKGFINEIRRTDSGHRFNLLSD